MNDVHRGFTGFSSGQPVCVVRLDLLALIQNQQLPIWCGNRVHYMEVSHPAKETVIS